MESQWRFNSQNSICRDKTSQLRQKTTIRVMQVLRLNSMIADRRRRWVIYFPMTPFHMSCSEGWLLDYCGHELIGCDPRLTEHCAVPLPWSRQHGCIFLQLHLLKLTSLAIYWYLLFKTDNEVICSVVCGCSHNSNNRHNKITYPYPTHNITASMWNPYQYHKGKLKLVKDLKNAPLRHSLIDID